LPDFVLTAREGALAWAVVAPTKKPRARKLRLSRRLFYAQNIQFLTERNADSEPSITAAQLGMMRMEFTAVTLPLFVRGVMLVTIAIVLQFLEIQAPLRTLNLEASEIANDAQDQSA
jgi:hypothetical protein